MKRLPTILLLLLCVLLRPAATAEKGNIAKLPPAASGKMDFQRDIRPLLARSCLRCHGPDKHSGGLRLDVRKAAFEGSNSGPVIKPGDAAGSRLLQVVAGLDPDTRMPPEGKPLTAAEIGKLRAWIEQGVKWPAGSETVAIPKSKHWAFIPPRRPPLPRVTGSAWLRNPIDAFILARLEKEHLPPSREADRVTLIRRLNLDLLGLPPFPAEVDAFVHDSRPGAYQRLVDRLLASPRYGERWGRHWLDLARYADSDGFEKDRERPHAWRYRHWVIAALNRDLPYDRFTVEQLAGDLLPKATLEQKMATGFHRNTLTNKECGVDKEQFRVEQTVDRTSTTATVFLGLTLACAQCHDHKYDPFSQREFYRFFAFFNGLEERDLVAPVANERALYLKEKADFDSKKAELEGAVAEYRNKRLPLAQRTWERDLDRDEIKQLPAKIRIILAVPARQRSKHQKEQLADYYAPLDVNLGILTAVLEDHQKQMPRLSMAPTLIEGKGRKTHILLRGDFLKKGAEVKPGVPAVLPSLRGGTNNTRLDLARWIVNPRNPLAARVAVNRLWQHHFGRGLVFTSDDFGTRGDRPTHPELLDWLATEFSSPSSLPSPLRGRGAGGEGAAWSLKSLHRLIVTSATYRQASVVRPALRKRDPHNLLLARQNRLRLEAEIIRDVALASAGLLDQRIGGPSVHPPQPAGIAEVTYLGQEKWEESTGLDRFRRGLYTFFRRTSPYPSLLTFDAPDSNVTCTRRSRSNTPLQALVLLNDRVYIEAAQTLARRVLREAGDSTADRLRHAFRLCLARQPTPRELRRLEQLFAAQLRLCRARPRDAAKLAGAGPPPARVTLPEAASWVGVARILMNLDEFITRE